MNIIDKTGEQRRPEDYAEARHVVERRMLTMTNLDPELFVQFSVIRDALLQAEAIASATAK